MGMICYLRQVSDDDIARLSTEPETISEFLCGPEIEEPKVGFFARLFGKKPEPVPPPSWTPPAAGEEIDLDKAWHGLHYLYTLTDCEGELPLGYLMRGGIEIGDDVGGYGPARGLHPDEVVAFSTALTGVTPEMLTARYNPTAMTELDIYPMIWEQSDISADDALQYLLEYDTILRDFLRACAARHAGVLIHMG